MREIGPNEAGPAAGTLGQKFVVPKQRRAGLPAGGIACVREVQSWVPHLRSVTILSNSMASYGLSYFRGSRGLSWRRPTRRS